MAPRRLGIGGKQSSWVSELKDLHWAGDSQIPPTASQGLRTELSPLTEEDRLWGHSSQG